MLIHLIFYYFIIKFGFVRYLRSFLQNFSEEILTEQGGDSQTPIQKIDIAIFREIVTQFVVITSTRYKRETAFTIFLIYL